MCLFKHLFRKQPVSCNANSWYLFFTVFLISITWTIGDPTITCTVSFLPDEPSSVGNKSATLQCTGDDGKRNRCRRKECQPSDDDFPNCLTYITTKDSKGQVSYQLKSGDTPHTVYSKAYWSLYQNREYYYDVIGDTNKNKNSRGSTTTLKRYKCRKSPNDIAKIAPSCKSCQVF